MKACVAAAMKRLGKAEKAFSRLLIFSGVFNIALAAPLIIPGLTGAYFAFLWQLNLSLGLGGTMPIAPQEDVNALLVNTAGVDLVLIGVMVIYAGLSPTTRRFIPLANAVGRILFAGIVAYYVFAAGLAQIVLLIGLMDVAISLGFLYYLRKV